jgi:hypothetical protein
MPGQKIPIEWESPVMKDDVVLSGIGSMPFPLPFTDRNKRLCKHFELVSNAEKNVVLDVDLELAGNFWARGKLVVSIKGGSYDCDFSETLSVIDIADKPIGDIVNNKILIDTAFKRWWAFVPVGTPSSIFIDIYFGYAYKSFTSTGGSNSDKMDDIYTQMLADDLVPLIFDIRRETQGSEEIIYFEVIEDEAIYQDTNIHVGGNFITFNTSYYGSSINWAKNQQDLVIAKLLSNINDVYPTISYCFPSIKNNEFYGDLNTNFNTEKLVNSYVFGYLQNSSEQSKYCISPQFYLFNLISKICAYLGFELIGDLKDIEQIYQRCFVYSNTALDLYAVWQNPGLTYTRTIRNVYKQNFNQSDCMPGNTIKDLLYCIQNTFNCSITTKNNQLEITTKKSLLNSSVINDWSKKSFKIYDEEKGCFEDGFFLKYANDSNDSYLSDHIKDITVNRKPDVSTFSALPTRNVRNNEIRFVSDENKFYQAKIPQNLNPNYIVKWQFYCIQLEGFEYLNAKKDIDSKNSATINDDLIQDFTRDGGGIRKINIPFIYEKGNSDEFELGYQKAPLRLLFYWGKKQGLLQTSPAEGDTPAEWSASSADEESYPFASMSNIDINGTVLGNYSLYYDGQYGLYEKFWKEWLEFRNQSKPLTIKVLMPISEFLQINIQEKIRINESVFFIDRIKADIGQNDREVICSIDLYKV